MQPPVETEQKTRSDAWDAGLADEVRWEIYDTVRNLQWPKEVADRLEGMGLARLPSRSAWYAFLTRMRRADAARRIERMAQSVAEAQGVADRAGIRSAVFVETLKTLAVDRAMTGDDKAASGFATAAAAIWDRAQRERELELRAAAQATKDAALKLAREKFEAAERRESAARSALGDTRLTDADKIAKMKEIFG